MILEIGNASFVENKSCTLSNDSKCMLSRHSLVKGENLISSRLISRQQTTRKSIVARNSQLCLPNEASVSQTHSTHKNCWSNRFCFQNSSFFQSGIAFSFKFLNDFKRISAATSGAKATKWSQPGLGAQIFQRPCKGEGLLESSFKLQRKFIWEEVIRYQNDKIDKN